MSGRKKRERERRECGERNRIEIWEGQKDRSM